MKQCNKRFIKCLQSTQHSDMRAGTWRILKIGFHNQTVFIKYKLERFPVAGRILLQPKIERFYSERVRRRLKAQNKFHPGKSKW